MKNIFASAFLLVLAGCIANGLIAVATFQGSGGFWTDGDTLVAVGVYEGDVTLHGGSTAIEIRMPIKVRAGEVLVMSQSRGESLMLRADTPLPAWASTVFRDGEAELLGLQFLEPET